MNIKVDIKCIYVVNRADVATGKLKRKQHKTYVWKRVRLNR